MSEASVGHQCPECVTEGRRSQRPARTAFGGGAAGRQGNVTKVLIGLNLLLMVLSIASDRGGDSMAGGGIGGLLGGRTPLTDWGSVIGYASLVPFGPVHGIAAGEVYRLITAMFLHYGVIHLLMNMWALWVLGRSLEAVLGPLRFLALYLIAGLGGNVAAYVLPQFVPARHLLHTVRDEYHGVVIESGLAEQQFFYGKGAGGVATASAVLSDLSALRPSGLESDMD
jgi:hypothetical protein